MLFEYCSHSMGQKLKTEAATECREGALRINPKLKNDNQGQRTHLKCVMNTIPLIPKYYSWIPRNFSRSVVFEF